MITTNQLISISLDHIGMGQNHVPLVNIPNKNMAGFMDAHSPKMVFINIDPWPYMTISCIVTPKKNQKDRKLKMT
jgi:hypothetical protein